MNLTQTRYPPLRFDFDHSKEISQSELVLLMLCTTRGLCKVVGLDRPGTDELETLATNAFASIDRDHSGEISLQEFSEWALREPGLLLYLKRFAATRLIFENQVQYDALLQQICNSFVQFAVQIEQRDAHQGLPFHHHHQQLACSTGTCKEVIKRHCPHTQEREVEYLVQAMQTTMEKRRSMAADELTNPLSPSLHCHSMDAGGGDGDALLPQLISMDVFCLIAASYVAFIVADEDQEHLLNLDELKVLLWLIRGKEPTPSIVDSYMKSLDRDHNGALSALEWVTFAVENDARTGTLSFTTQIHLLFTHADRNGDAMLTLHELCQGLKPILLQNLVVAEEMGPSPVTHHPEAICKNRRVASLALEKQLKEHADAINSLIAGLANELMEALDKNQSHRIEWYEFRQQVDYLERRVHEMKSYIKDFVLTQHAS